MDNRSDDKFYNKRGELQIRGFDEYLRKFLLEIIEQDYQSISKFCDQNDFERNDVRRFLKGERNWSFSKVLVLLNELDYQTFGISKDFITTQPKAFKEFQVIREGVSIQEKKKIKK